MLDLYFAPTPNGWKITIMLEECGLEYRVKPVNLGKGDQFKPDFLKISPNNRMPALVDPRILEGLPNCTTTACFVSEMIGKAAISRKNRMSATAPLISGRLRMISLTGRLPAAVAAAPSSGPPAAEDME